MDPLSISAGVVGFISLGIQLSQSLVDYYSSYKNQFRDVNRTVDKLQGLHNMLTDLEAMLKNRIFHQDQKSLVRNMENRVKNCEGLLDELEVELQKLRDTPHTGIRDAIRSAGRRVAYPFRQSTLQKLDEDIAELRGNLTLALAALQLDYSEKVRNDIGDIKEVLELVRANQLTSEIRQWLRAPDATVNFNEQCSKKHPLTGLWFVDSPIFTTWLEGKNSFLWLNGFAGCGKSILSSTAIQYTLRRRRSNPLVGIAFYYFTFREEAKQNVGGMLRALLLQLSNQVPDGAAVMRDLQKLSDDGLPSVPALLTSLRDVCHRFENVYVILDALDECPRGEKRSELMDILTELRKSLNGGFHFLVTSRDEPDIRENLDFEPHEEIRMKNAGVDKDIAEFISGKLDNDRALRKWSAYHEKIKQALTGGAHGVFRWVECQFKSLASCPRSEYHLEEVLKSLPPSLDETYNRMLMSIEGVSQGYAQRILALLCVSRRPLAVEELIDAIAVDLGKDPRFNPSRRLQDAIAIQEICPGFVEFDEGRSREKYDQYTASPNLQIAHCSVQEYLTSDRILSQAAKGFGVSLQEAHLEIVQTCLVYLINVLDEPVSISTFEIWPFIFYAACHWSNHYRSAGCHAHRADALLLTFITSQTAFGKWARCIASKRRYPSCGGGALSHLQARLMVDSSLDGTSPPLCCATALNLHSIVHRLIDTGADVNEEDSWSGNALEAAIREGYEETVQLLVNGGADLEANADSCTALHLASSLGPEKIVRILLDGGANVNSRGKSGTVITKDSSSGHEKIAQKFLKRGADITCWGGYKDTALTAASISGREEIVQLLLDHGADVNWKGTSHIDAFGQASLNGHENIVRLLIDRGASVNGEEGSLSSALSLACASGKWKVIKLLIDRGSNVNAVDDFGQSVLDEVLDSAARNSRLIIAWRESSDTSLWKVCRDEVKIINILRRHGALEMAPASRREQRSGDIRDVYAFVYGKDESTGAGRVETVAR